jgi:CPA1 family monovalent cation:H+ antiporter
LLRLLRLYARWKKRENIAPHVSFRIIITTTLAGVRGAITLAAVLSLPLTLPDGAPFPGRGILVLIATGVILLSLLVATVGLPPLLRSIVLPEEDPRTREEREARAATAAAAITALDKMREQRAEDTEDTDEATLYAEVAAQIMANYQRWLEPDSDAEDKQSARQTFAMERTLRLAALKAERAELYRLRSNFKINDITLRRIMTDIDLTEAALRGGRRRSAH